MGLKPQVFVMSDVVGSTRLWEVHGDSMKSALENHDRVVHGAMHDAGGRVFKHTGDGMIAVFGDADGAIEAAVRCVDALPSERWGGTGPLQIRISIHAGVASERDGDYFGPPVNQVARINGICNGGQVLVSDGVRQLMAEPAGIDLGEHQLRDLSEPIRLWQLDNGEHPPLRTLKQARHNLPIMPTAFIGRQTEVDELRALIDSHRLVTISGVGGCGKTRLAVEVASASAERYPGGVWFVDLTTERDDQQVADRALASLGLSQQQAAGGSAINTLSEATVGSATLLVLDNCEHLIDGVADFATDVLAAAPNVTVLATSREALNVDGERAWRIPNMQAAAVELFIDRASAAGVTGLDQRHEQIQQICAQLDDIPLAIELAAARSTSLSIDELAQRLDDRFSLLSGGRSRRRQRQQTLQAMMDWSYGLLTDDEQQVLNQLSVFAGSFPLAGVEAVARSTTTPIVDLMDSLVEQSLVVALVDSGRYRLLETVRLYALDRLIGSEQLGATRDRHLTWIRNLSGRERLASARDGDTWELEEQKLLDVSNALSAMEWAEEIGDHDALLSLFVGGSMCWASTSMLAMSWLDRIPEPPATNPDLRLQWKATCAEIRILTGDEAGGYGLVFEATTMADELVAQPSPEISVPMLSAYLYRGVFMALSAPPEVTLAECDRIESLQVPGRPRIAEWVASQLRTVTLMFAADDRASTEVLRTEAVGRTISRYITDNTAVLKGILLSRVDCYDESLDAAMTSLRSDVLGQTNKLNSLVPAAVSLAALGRFREAVEIVEWDFGPMIRAQRARLFGSQLASLVLILHRLGHHDRMHELLPIGYAHGHQLIGFDQAARAYFADVLGGVEALENLPKPDPAELHHDRIEQLVRELIVELYDLVSLRTSIASGAMPQL